MSFISFLNGWGDNSRGNQLGNAIRGDNGLNPADTAPPAEPGISRPTVNINKGIKKIEKAGYPQKDGLISKGEIDHALEKNKLKGSDKDFWQNVSQSFGKLDTDHGANVGKDGVLNINDIQPFAQKNGWETTG